MQFSPARTMALALMALLVSSAVFAQLPAPPRLPRPQGPQEPSQTPPSANLNVYLRTEGGRPLADDVSPMVRISSRESGAPLASFPTRAGDAWVFTGLAAGGEYEVEVTANGYLPEKQSVTIPNIPGATASVIVFLRLADKQLLFRRPGGQFVLAPKPAKEIQHALKDLQSGRIASARKHAEKALKLAPGNPYVQYVMGMTFMLSNQFAQAKPYLENSVSIDPGEAPSLAALGTARLQLGDVLGAVEVLQKAVQLDAKSWKAEWLLASADLGVRKYADARDHAERALKIGKQEARPVQLILGKALAGLGEREAAASAFETFAKQFPSNPEAAKARRWAEMLRQPQPPLVPSPQPGTGPNAGVSSPVRLAESSAASGVSPQPPVEVPPSPNWAPPDIDAVRPFVVSTATCPVRQVLTQAGKHAEEFVNGLQEFSAKEDFQKVELKNGNNLKNVSEDRFEYLVFIDRASPEAFDVQEIRQRNSQPVGLPGKITDEGAPALALAFHPVVQKNLDWECEGLGTWDGQAAWVIHFAQKPKAPNVLSWFYGPSGSYPVALKGRAWISERSYQVLHLDSDLVSPIAAIDLKRLHDSIDYRPVRFREHNVRLWLPQTVDTYIQYQGHFWHFYHRYSDFKLFWVGASQKISQPKEETQRQQ